MLGTYFYLYNSKILKIKPSGKGDFTMVNGGIFYEENI